MLRSDTTYAQLYPGFNVMRGVTTVLCCTTNKQQVLSDWDRFARGEYLRLAVEEEPDDMQVGVSG